MSQNQKFEREIEEILARLDDFPQKRRKIRFRRRVANVVDRAAAAVGAVLGRFSAGQVLLAGIVLILVGYFVLRGIDGDIARYTILLGFVLFVGAFIASLLPRRSGPRPSRYWRGRPVDYEQPTFSDRMRGFWGRLTRRR